MEQEQTNIEQPKKKRGRPFGSKNKKPRLLKNAKVEETEQVVVVTDETKTEAS